MSTSTANGSNGSGERCLPGVVCPIVRHLGPAPAVYQACCATAPDLPSGRNTRPPSRRAGRSGAGRPRAGQTEVGCPGIISPGLRPELTSGVTDHPGRSRRVRRTAWTAILTMNIDPRRRSRPPQPRRAAGCCSRRTASQVVAGSSAVLARPRLGRTDRARGGRMCTLRGRMPAGAATPEGSDLPGPALASSGDATSRCGAW
jgi:hypothetical protein